MKSTVLITVTAVTFVAAAFTTSECSSWYTIEEGRKWEIHEHDAKGNLTSKVQSEVMNVTNISNGIEAQVHARVLDDKNKELSNTTYGISCIDGSLRFDMKRFLPEEQMEAFKDMEVTIATDYLEFPSVIATGQTLRDGVMVLTIKNAGMEYGTVTVRIYNRKVEKQENISVPAGTYDCFKITEDYEIILNMMGMSVPTHTKSAQWISRRVGIVRTESYNRQGKIENYSVLGSFN